MTGKHLRLPLCCVLLSLLLAGCDSGGAAGAGADGLRPDGIQPDAGSPRALVMRAASVLEGSDALAELSDGTFCVWAWTRDSVETTPGSGVFDYDDALWLGTPQSDGSIAPVSVYHRHDGIWSTQDEFLWPSDYYACDFYAIYPSFVVSLDVTPRSGSQRPLRRFSYDASRSADVLAAAVMCKKETARQNAAAYYTANGLSDDGGGMAPLAFHHVLSKVSLKACRISGTPELGVTVRSVTLCNVRQQGTFTFRDLPRSTPGSADPIGWWTLGASRSEVTLYKSTEGTALTTAGQDYVLSDGSSQQTLLPQPLTAWDLTTAAASSTGAYLKIGCTVTVDGYEGNFADDGYVYVPFSADWTMGNHYTYTLRFGTGYDRDGRLLLKPVTVTGTVEPWTTGTTQDIDPGWL